MLSSRRDDGFTLMELLVVVVLIGIVSAVVATGLVRSMQATDQAQVRIDAFNELQIALENVARELRAADPVLPGFGAQQMTAQIYRDGRCIRFTPRIANGALLLDRSESSNGCVTMGVSTTRTLVTDVAGGSTSEVYPSEDAANIEAGTTVFAYARTDGTQPALPEEIAVIRMTLTRQLRGQPQVTVSTVVNVRNTR